MAKIKAPFTWRMGVGSLVIFTLIVMAYVSPLKDLFNFDNLMFWGEKLRALGWIKWSYFFVFMGAVVFLPITLFAVLGGILFPYSIALPFNLLATAVGAMIPFFIARVFGRGAAESFCRDKARSLTPIVEAKGIRTVLLIRCLGMPPFLMANYAFGLSAVRPRDYFWGTILGILPWMAMLTYAAHSLWQAALMGGQKGFFSALGMTMGPLMTISGFVLVSLVVTTVIRRRGRRDAV